MSVLVIRHGLSEANNRANLGTLAFASGEAPLMQLGIEQAWELNQRLRTEYDIDVGNTQVATSQLKRTQETAWEAGFHHLATYPVLNEVDHGMELPKLRTALHFKELPEAALKAAETILENPPTESIWITHGLVIAGLCQILGASQDARFIPRFCEIRELPIESASLG